MPVTPSDSTEILLRLDAHGRDIQEVKALAAEGVAEQKKTNGRVTKLERDAEIEEALRHDRADREASHRRKWEFIRPAGASLLCGAVLLVGQHFIT